MISAGPIIVRLVWSWSCEPTARIQYILNVDSCKTLCWLLFTEVHDFQMVRDRIFSSQGLLLASPIFFYAVSAQTKILMDRFQSQWVKKYWIDKTPYGHRAAKRVGLFISAGATTGRKLFDGASMTVRYFFDVLDTEFWKSLTYRGLDFEGDVLKFPKYLEESYQAGRDMVHRIRSGCSSIEPQQQAVKSQTS
jgi:multimeric flavodoxin WrbA